MKDSFKQDLIDGAKEFYEKDGLVSVEFSVKRENINEIFDFIKNEVETLMGVWYVAECSACRLYNGDEYVHLSLENHPDTIKYIKENYVIRMYDSNKGRVSENV